MEFSDISIGGGIVIAVILFMLVGIIRGATRMFFGLVALAIAGLAAYWGFMHGESIAGYAISNPDPWMSGTIGVIMGLAVFFVARALFSLIIKPMKMVDGKVQNKGGLGGILGILGGLAFAWFAISATRYVANLAELQWLKDSLAKENEIQELARPSLLKIRDTLDSSMPGKFHRDFDFLNNASRVEMARLKVLTENTYAMNVAAKHAGVMKAFGQPDIRKLLESTPELNSYVEADNFGQLLEAKKLCELCDIPAARETLAESDVIEALGLAPKPEKKAPKKPNPKAKK